MEADFSGWASKADIKCSDGRTINADAFKHQHLQKVPLVWQHVHGDPTNVLGHALLENRPGEGMYAYAFFNSTAKAQHAKAAVEHGDVNRLSIWANDLVQKSGRVLHGAIREVSLVLSGANPGAVIENIAVAHGDVHVYDDEAIIHTDLPLEHEQPSAKETKEELKHEDGEDSGEKSDNDTEDGETILDVYESMTDDQKKVVHYMVGEALAAADEKNTDEEVKQDNLDDTDKENLSHENQDNKEGSTMTTHNIFEQGSKKEQEKLTLSHSDMKDIWDSAFSSGSLKKTMQAYAEEHLEHGIIGLEILFPEAKAVTQTPEWDKRRTEWVSAVLSGASKRPFSRIKSWSADITFEEARAKGYVKGNMKKEEWFSVAKRETGPQTVYKKQKLDRDDIIDIVDFDVVVWMKGEMRLMLDEEIARAILVGDGREVGDEDRIDPTKIRPIATDDPYYTVPVYVNLADANSSPEEVVDALILAREYYKGTGTPTFFTTQRFISQTLLARDEMGRKIYKSEAEVASDMGVSRLVAVEILNQYPSIIGVLVNMADYTIGTDKGGEVTFFDDFDIDFNQNKYLIETRLSGALTKPASAQVVLAQTSGATAAIPLAPTWDSEEGELTIPTVTGVTYKDGEGNTLTAAASPYTITPGDTIVVQAWPASSSYYLTPGYKARWTYLSNPDNA